MVVVVVVVMPSKVVSVAEEKPEMDQRTIVSSQHALLRIKSPKKETQSTKLLWISFVEKCG